MFIKASPIINSEPAVSIFGAAPLSTVDGPGKRTLVFFQGCHLRCPWCHSPHSQPGCSPLLFHAQHCALCMRCVETCPNGVHVFTDGVHTLYRENCRQCGQCVEACPNSSSYTDSGALCLPTKTVAVESLFRQLMPYLFISDGITLSGGEALRQPGVLSFLQRCKDEGIHTCVETSGLLDAPVYEATAPYVDAWLFGARVLTDSGGRFHTDTLITNIRAIQKHPSSTFLPVLPLIPGITDRADVQRETLAVLRETGAKTLRLNPWNRHYSLYYTASGLRPAFNAPSEEDIEQCSEKTRTFFTYNGFSLL